MPHDPGRPSADEHLPYFSRYIDLVPDGEIVAQLEAALAADFAALSALPPDQRHHRYGPEKWSVQEVIGHLSDAERVFAYRALRIARGDVTPLEGFDEQTWMRHVNFDARDWPDLLEEWRAVRAASLGLYRSLEPEAWVRIGTANNHATSVRALAYITLGHELHHRALLCERYGVIG